MNSANAFKDVCCGVPDNLVIKKQRFYGAVLSLPLLSASCSLWNRCTLQNTKDYDQAHLHFSLAPNRAEGFKERLGCMEIRREYMASPCSNEFIVTPSDCLEALHGTFVRDWARTV
jgi:hypothetical protein